MSGRIDVHHHFLPPEYVAAWGEDTLAKTAAAGRLFGWSVARTLDLMGFAGIETAMLSISSPGFRLGDPDRARLCRFCNDLAAGIGRDHPGRFGMFANLPLPDLDLALTEIEYGLDVLGADGVTLYSNYQGRHLGDPGLQPMWQELNRRKAVVYVHPTQPAGGGWVPGISVSTLEFPFETTRTIVSLLYHGTPERFPDIRFIFSHAGGAMPYLAGRVATLSDVNPNFRQRGFAAVIPALRRFHYDITQAANPYTFRALLELVPVSQLLFGSDIPFASQSQIGLTITGLAELGLEPDQVLAIDRDNALALFARFAGPAT